MTSPESCSGCGGAGYLPSNEPCRCTKIRRVRAHIDGYGELAAAKPVKSLVPLDNVRIHGEWSLVRQYVAYHIARAFVQERPVEAWLTTSSDLRSLYLSTRGDLPRALQGKTFVLVRVTNVDNRLVGTALHELATLCCGRTPIWLVTSPPEKALEEKHRAWTAELKAVLDDGFPMFDFVKEASSKEGPSKETRPKQGPGVLERIGKAGES